MATFGLVQLGEDMLSVCLKCTLPSRITTQELLDKGIDTRLCEAFRLTGGLHHPEGVMCQVSSCDVILLSLLSKFVNTLSKVAFYG